jgi:hypothetical protein
MEYGYVIDPIEYNTISGLYNVRVKIDEDVKIISCYRILNQTILKYTENPGYFLISPNSKYIYISDKTDINSFFKNLIFSKNNTNYSNQDLLDFNIDPIKKYTKISSIDILPESCINLALEDDNTNRNYQIVKANLYNNYDCLVKNVVNMADNSFTNIEPKKTGIFESLSYYLTGSPSIYEHNKDNNTNCNITVNSVMEDVNEYNTFYIYGLTSLNLLFIIIIIIMVFNIVQDSEKLKIKSKKNTFDL